MRDAVLELISSYENTLSSVESLVAAGYSATAVSNDGLDDLDGQRARLVRSLEETLARNCSLRRKDFNRIMEHVLSASEQRKKELEKEQKSAGATLKAHLEELRRLTASVRNRLDQVIQEDADKDNLEAVVRELKAIAQDEGKRVLSELCSFQRHLDAFRHEEEEMNHTMQRLIDRDAALGLEDLRQLEADRSRDERKADRQLRRAETERLLAHFRQHRLGEGRPWRQRAKQTEGGSR
jgi:hypothetical protein